MVRIAANTVVDEYLGIGTFYCISDDIHNIPAALTVYLYGIYEIRIDHHLSFSREPIYQTILSICTK